MVSSLLSIQILEMPEIYTYIYIYLASKYDIDVTTVLLMLLIYKSLQSYNSVRDTLFSVVDVLYKLTNASAFWSGSVLVFSK